VHRRGEVAKKNRPRSKKTASVNESVDVAIIGAGTAGLSALREVRKRTERYVLIEHGPGGTTCARVGCMPSKALIEAANAFHRRTTFEEFGIRGAGGLSVDVAAVLRRVRRLRDDFVRGTLKITERLGDHVVEGRARLLGPDRLEVNGRQWRARSIIIATGARPVVPPAWRALGDRLLTTDTLFEQEALPPRMAVLGLGPVGVEIAQALSRLGMKVSAFDGEQNVAGLSDPEVNAATVELLRREISVHLGSKAELKADGAGVRVRAGDADVVVDRIVAALGRRPNVEDLGLETLGVDLDERGLPPVDPGTMQVGGLPVFMAGDANGDVPLLHQAADEGHIAGLNATQPTAACFERRTPLVIVFADPNVAMVGRRFGALERGTFRVGEVRFERQGRARSGQHDKGILRLYAEPTSGRLLGSEMCAPAGEHIAHLLALAMERSLTVRDMLRMPFYHPVLEEGVRTALRELAAQGPGADDSDLASCGALGAEALE
jgi:dihydrolipoamide dehydrogenase